MSANCEVSAKNLLNLIETYSLNSTHYVARDIEWLFYDDHLKPFLQWIFGLFAPINILSAAEFEKYQQLRKNKKLITSSEDLTEKRRKIESKYPSVFSCTENRLIFAETKLKMLNEVEANFQSLLNYQKELNFKLSCDLSELSKLKESAKQSVDCWQSEALRIASFFDWQQQNTAECLLQHDKKSILETIFTTENELKQFLERIEATVFTCDLIVSRAKAGLIQVENTRELLLNQETELLQLYCQKCFLETKMLGFLESNMKQDECCDAAFGNCYLKIEQISKIRAFLDLKKARDQLDLQLCRLYRLNFVIFNELLDILEHSLSMLLMKNLYHDIELCLSKKMSFALKQFLSFAYFKTIQKSKMDLLKSAESSTSFKSMHLKSTNKSSLWLFLEQFENRFNKNSKFLKFQKIAKCQQEFWYSHQMLPAKHLITFLNNFLPVSYKIDSMVKYIYHGSISAPTLLSRDVFSQLDVFWSKMVLVDEVTLKDLSKLLNHVLKEVQDKKLEHFKYFLWIYFSSDERLLQKTMQIIVTKNQQLKSSRLKLITSPNRC